MGQPKLLRAPSLLAPVISWCGVYLWPPARTRSLALPLSSTAHPSALCTLARPRGATVEGLWVRRCFWQSPRRRASRPPLPFSPFSGTRDGAPGRLLALRFLCFTANHGKTRRKMHLLCKHAATTREDGWKEELVTHSGAIQLHSLSLSGVVIDGRTGGRTDGRTEGTSIRLYPRSESCIECAPRVGLMEKTHTGSRLCSCSYAARRPSGVWELKLEWRGRIALRKHSCSRVALPISAFPLCAYWHGTHAGALLPHLGNTTSDSDGH